MSIIARLAVILGLDSAEFNAGLGKAESGVKKFEAVLGLAKTANIALGAAFVASSYKAIQFADQMDELATANGIATSTILELSQALSTNGGKVEDVGKMLSTFTNKIDEAATGSQKTRDKFKQLGISLDDIGRLSETDLLRKTIDGLSKIPDSITRSALKFDLLGKSARNVDIDGLNESFRKLQGTMEGSDEAFASIAKSLDKLEILGQQIKVDLANDLSEPFEKAIEAADKFYKHLRNARLENIRQQKAEQAKITESAVATGAGWHEKLFGGFMGDAYKSAKAGANTDRYIPETNTWNYRPNFDVPKKGDPLRNIEQTPEQIAAAKKAKLDAEKALADAAKDTAQWAIQREAEERTAREARAKEVAQMVIRQSELYRVTMQQAVLDKERLDYQKTLVNMSDTQRDKALALYDIEKEMVLIQKQNPAFSPEMIENIKRVKTEAVLAQEELTRAQNTFQAGWNRAYENFTERAKDSASIGASAFQSMASSMESALDNFVRTGKLSFSDLINSMISDLLRMMMKAQMNSIFGSIFGGGEGFGSFLTSSSTDFANGGGLLGAVKGIFGFANGGEPPVGVPSIVGERGAELFVPKTAGTIIPNHSLSSALGGQPQTVYNGTVIQNMNAIDTQSGIQFLTKNKDTIWAANQSAQRALPMSR